MTFVLRTNVTRKSTNSFFFVRFFLVELKKIDNPKYKARLHQVKFAFKLAKVKLTKIKPIKARKGVVPKGHYDKSGDRLAAAWAITATDGKNTKSGELIFQDGYDGGFFIDKDFMGINVNKKNKIPRNIQRWMIMMNFY